MQNSPRQRITHSNVNTAEAEKTWYGSTLVLTSSQNSVFHQSCNVHLDDFFLKMLICAHQGVFLPFTFCPVANCLLPPNISQVSSGNFQIAWLLFRMSNLAFLYCSPMLSLGSTWLPSPRLFSTSAAPFPNQTLSLEDKYMQELHKVTSQVICKAC